MNKKNTKDLKVGSGVSVSGDLIGHVQKIYELALQDSLSGKAVRHGINSFSSQALPAYILAVAAVEAFINETCLSFSARAFQKTSQLGNYPKDWIEKVEIGIKVLLIPQLLFDRVPARNAQPYQDFATLIRVRNDLVHYKMQGTQPKYIRDLEQRRIILVADQNPYNADYSWPHKLSCTEGIRWANNTACNLVAEIAGYDNSQNSMFFFLVQNFKQISEKYVQDWFNEHGIDPSSNHP